MKLRLKGSRFDTIQEILAKMRQTVMLEKYWGLNDCCDGFQKIEKMVEIVLGIQGQVGVMVEIGS